MQQEPIQYHQFIIIGAGISGLMSGLVLAEQDKDFLIIQASDRVGGRIRTQKLKDVIEKQRINKKWINQEILNTPVEVGATWVSKQHSYILKLVEDFQLSLFPQYSDGLAVYGVNQNKYEKVQTLADFYKKYQKQLVNLVNKIQNLTINMYQISNSNNLSPSQSSLLQEYIKFYDNMTVSKFIRSQISDPELADMIMNQMQTLQCISCDNFSVLQLIDDDGCMQLLKLYCDKVDDTIDGLKVREGMVSIVEKLAQKIYQILEENQSEYYRKDLIQLNSPVLEIQNELGEDVIVTLKNGKKYSCMKVIFSAPIAVANQIKISKISPSKKLIFQNQQYGSVTRFYFVFPQAFWRGKYNGYASFSRKFPFNQLTQISPASLSCGIVAFVFVHNKFEAWQQQLRSLHGQVQNIEQQQIKYMLKILADMYLQGDLSSLIYHNTSHINAVSTHYNTSVLPTRLLQNLSGDDYNDSYSRDQYNIVYVGSQIADAEDYGSYMEGAVRSARRKMCQLLEIEDKWEKVKGKVIEW